MFANKFFGVFGLGISGISTLKFLKKHNIKFVAYDDNATTISNIVIKYPELISHLVPLEDIKWKSIEYLVLSPGIPLEFPAPHKVIKIADQAKIISDIELLYLSNPKDFFIGITGTNGKSTTTALIGHILKFNKYNVEICGNIGRPVLDIESSDEKRVFVIETSSFQIDLLDKTKFNIALILNITPDHLDRHGSMENYTKTKFKIFNNQTKDESAIVNYNLSANSKYFTFSESEEKANVLVKNNKIYYNNASFDLPKNNSLLGEHNAQNIAAAFTCCIKFGLKPEQIINSLPSFVGLKHRMQYVGVYNNVVFINDSKATNADSTEKALKSFDSIIWILGGVEKEGGITSLKPLFSKIKHALLIGKATENFANTLEGAVNYTKCDNLQNAFKLACELASANDVVLLSPACASYDQWKNFEERGDAFIEMVKQLEI